ncbi:hypothetical protein JB92DRAFT_747358 [Gautieria morchelliformis]|nr:hypothetical protein JB92DRAFT_747358 [Gautieria morchelliformis]
MYFEYVRRRPIQSRIAPNSPPRLGTATPSHDLVAAPTQGPSSPHHGPPAAQRKSGSEPVARAKVPRTYHVKNSSRWPKTALHPNIGILGGRDSRAPARR